MARLNTRDTRVRAGSSPIRTTGVEAPTHEGGQGFLRDEQSELFLLAVGSFHGEGSFYESADDRTRRFRNLVCALTTTDPVWVGGFLAWLRGPEANIRTAALVGAVEYAHTLQRVSQEARELLRAPTIRSVVNSVLQRAEEPGELLAYWLSQYGRPIPSAVKRGIGDAVIRLTTEYAYAKYDSGSRAIRFADVLNLVRPGDRESSSQSLQGEWQHELFEFATSSPYRDVEPGEHLPMLRARRALMAVPVAERRDVVLNQPGRLAEAGMTWEAVAGWLQGPMDAVAWEAVIPQMGVMALIRNLRNFDEAGISGSAVAKVAAKISDPEVVARSRQLPFRWLAAYNAVSSDRYRAYLGDALELSTRNVPDFPGRTLILVDVSASMGSPMSEKSKMTMMDAAGLFGTALAARLPGRVDLVAFGTSSKTHPLPRGGAILRHAQSFRTMGNVVGHGTNTWQSVREHYKDHDRIMIFTDGQTFPDPYGVDSTNNARVYTWNLGGYRAALTPSGEGNMQEVGGLSDATFRLLPLMERGKDAAWPWEQ